MPRRNEPFINRGIYHVFNRTLDHNRIFLNPELASLFLELLWYYRSAKSEISYSYFRSRIKISKKNELEKAIGFQKYFKVSVLAFCLMPNHFHLILEQKINNGVPHFIANVLNSFTRSYNICYHRKGPVFLPQFHSVKINTPAQLAHVSRYIHLNPYSSNIVQNFDQLQKYPYSSLRSYFQIENDRIYKRLIDVRPVLRLFKFEVREYYRYVEGRAEYQKFLEKFKH